MRVTSLFRKLNWALMIFAIPLLMTGTRAVGQREQVVHSFGGGSDGASPVSGLILDASGNLYGTTYNGGSGTNCGFYCGTVFELGPRSVGWGERVLHNFTNNGKDGQAPEASLVVDSSGNLYGTTYNGGVSGVGVVFELTPKAGVGWTEEILHNFCSQLNCVDGAYPHAGLIIDASGNLYGTTHDGGTGTGCNNFHGCGTVFELSPKAGGGWSGKILHSFVLDGKDGNSPWYDGLILDSAGNLYGATYYGGSGGTCPGQFGFLGCGTVFELSPRAGGGWAEKILHSFSSNGTDGYFPSSVILDAAGNLYGTTAEGGTGTCSINGGTGCGTVFELSPLAGGSWQETILHNFNNNNIDGYNPYAGLLIDGPGNLYGTTTSGGAGACSGSIDTGCGTVFELSPGAGGNWTEAILHNFSSNGTDGYAPYAGLIFDGSGHLYGTTVAGGRYGGGTAFEVEP